MYQTFSIFASMRWSHVDLREGKVAIKYGGNFNKLNRVLSKAFPQDTSKLEILVFCTGDNYFTGHNFSGDKPFWVQTPLEPISTPIVTENEIF